MTEKNYINNFDLLPVVEEIRALKPAINAQVPNPAPLGLIGFGLTTALLQMKHTRLTGSEDEEMDGVNGIVVGYAMFFGGAAQAIAGLCEIKRNNLFGFTAFLLYGAFWMSFGMAEIVQMWAVKPSGINEEAVQCMLTLVGVFTTVLWICTFKMHLTINLLFFFLAITLFLLSAGVKDETVDKVGGWAGIITATIAYWLAAVELINDILGEGREIIPLGRFHFACLNRNKKESNKVVCETLAAGSEQEPNV